MATSWQRLAYVTNGSSTTTTLLDTANDSSFSGDDFTAKRHLKFLINIRDSDSGQWVAARFGDSSGISTATYYWESNEDGGTDAAGNSDKVRLGADSDGGNDVFVNVDIPENIDGEDKLLISHYMRGKDGHTLRVEMSSRSPISGPITRVQLSLEFGSVNFGAYTSLLVLGADDQEDAPPNLPNGATFLTSDTNKLYMWDGTDTWNEVA